MPTQPSGPNAESERLNRRLIRTTIACHEHLSAQFFLGLPVLVNANILSCWRTNVIGLKHAGLSSNLAELQESGAAASEVS